MKICRICRRNTSLSFKKNVLVLTVRTGLLQCKSHCCFITSHWHLPAAGGSLTTAWFTLGNHSSLQHQVNLTWMHFKQLHVLLTCLSAEQPLIFILMFVCRCQNRIKLQVSMASEEETLPFGVSFVWEWSQASSSSERSSSGKGTLQYWKEL